jgi:hypothetical protein
MNILQSHTHPSSSFLCVLAPLREHFFLSRKGAKPQSAYFHLLEQLTGELKQGRGKS